jgi:putative ABC transport system ATP-binding protein
MSSQERSKTFAYIMQDNEQGTLGAFTVLENLCFALNKGQSLSVLRPALSKDKKQRVGELLYQYAPQFLERLNQKVSSLSGGQRQVLSILMNIVSDAKVLLLDEPTAALDDRTTEQVISQIQQWVRERNLIAVMVCHDLSLVERYADRRLEL